MDSINSERNKRRINVQFVQEDVRRKMRKSNPEVPGKAIRSVFNALMRAGVLLHRDGSPVRTGSAPFTMSKDATELNHALADIYLDALHHAEIEMPAVPLLSEMFYGDATHTEQVEKTIAYLQVNAQEALNERELDALLTVEDTEVDETVRVDKVDSTIELTPIQPGRQNKMRAMRKSRPSPNAVHPKRLGTLRRRR